MRKDILEEVCMDIYKTATDGKDDMEHIIATVHCDFDATLEWTYSPTTLESLLVSRAHSLGQDISHQLVSLMNDIQGIGGEEIGTYELFSPYDYDHSLEMLEDDSEAYDDEINKLAFDERPIGVVETLLYIDNKGKQDTLSELKEYTIIVVSWSRYNVNKTFVHAVNLYHYIIERLRGGNVS